MTEETVKIAVIDLDGVCADSSMREQLAKNTIALLMARGSLEKMLKAELDATWKSIFYSRAGLFNPDLVEHDTRIDGAYDAIIRLLDRGWKIIFQSSRPEYLRAATLEWLSAQFDMQELAISLVLCPYAARDNFTRTPVLKAIQLEAIIHAYHADMVVYVDDDSKNRETFEKSAGHLGMSRAYSLRCYASLADVVEATPLYGWDNKGE